MHQNDKIGLFGVKTAENKPRQADREQPLNRIKH